MRLLDLCCRAGGAAMGYYQAGFTEIVGVDIDPQKRYPFAFVQMDALEALSALLAGGFISDTNGKQWRLKDFDLIHASPPCQFGSECTPVAYRANHKNMIPDIRRLLLATGKPFIIENVAGSRSHLINPVMLCGSMFDLPIFRHRYFETNQTDMILTPPCKHSYRPVLITGMGKRLVNGKRYQSPVADKLSAMKIDWMTEAEVTQAIPPAYTKFIGGILMQYLLSDIT